LGLKMSCGGLPTRFDPTWTRLNTSMSSSGSRSTIREKGIDHAKIEHFANFWIRAKGKNGNKSNKHPAEYFKDVPAYEMKRALIDADLLDFRRYSSFLAERSAGIIKAITKEVGL